LSTLPALLPNTDDRRLALQTCSYIAGAVEDMDPDVQEMFKNFFKVLDIPYGSVPDTAPDHAHHHVEVHPLEDVAAKKPTASAAPPAAAKTDEAPKPEAAPKSAATPKTARVTASAKAATAKTPAAPKKVQ
jgi:hypothetical protein